jgi:hypothetical protein
MTEWYILGWTFIGMLIVLALLFGIKYDRGN